MKKVLVTLMLAAACFAAMAQDVKDSLWDEDEKISVQLGQSKWELSPVLGATYNYSLRAPEGLSNSGWGLDLSLLEMHWNGWKGGALTLGILDVNFDWQYLLKGQAFDGKGGIGPALDGRGHRTDFTFGFPVGINQQFGSKFGISLIAVPGIGFYTYRNKYIKDDIRHVDTLYPTKGRVGFRLNLKGILWYGDFGVVIRYQPIPSPDLNTNLLSVGFALRSN